MSIGNILITVLGLSFLVFIHELGHFLAARWVGARVEIFSLGFGKRLWGFRRGETDYRVSAVPLGGYVKITGQEAFEDLEGKSYELASKSIPQRGLVFVAGPAMNYIFAVLVFAGVFWIGSEVPTAYSEPPVIGWVAPESPALSAGIQPGDVIRKVEGREVASWTEAFSAMEPISDKSLDLEVFRAGQTLPIGIPVPDPEHPDSGFPGFSFTIPARIGSVLADSPAEHAGMLTGDLITAVDGQPIAQFNDIHLFMRGSEGKPLQMTVRREDGEHVLTVTPKLSPGTDRPLIGITAQQDTVREHDSLPMALYHGFTRTNSFSVLMVTSLVSSIAKGNAMDEIGGPITIARVTNEAAKKGWGMYVAFLALLSLNLALLNMLPIPILDGGHILFLGIEATFGKDRATKLKMPALQFGLLLMLTLSLFVLFNDVRLLGRDLPMK